ncbi:hypothetical protein INT45_006037 [Circinella minor]|uniref:Uncharacterized protein n=1 Tax=Circinella minor TaxID=1195481 RepID=A0A8H7RZX8_9FUNG|nr:hypothetical protein INT45_006037 [Circinella minor]
MEEYQGLEGEALNGVWYERYKKQHMNIKASAKIKKPKFNPIIWNSIMNKVLTRRALYEEYTEGDLKVLVAAAQGTTQEAERIENGDDEKGEVYINAVLSELGFKLVEKLNENGFVLLSSLKVQGDGIEQRIYKEIIHLLYFLKRGNTYTMIMAIALLQVLSMIAKHIKHLIAPTRKKNVKSLELTDDMIIDVFCTNSVMQLMNGFWKMRYTLTNVGLSTSSTSSDALKLLTKWFPHVRWSRLEEATPRALDIYHAKMTEAFFRGRLKDTVDDLLVEIQTQKLDLTKEKERTPDLCKLLHIKINPTAFKTTYHGSFPLILDFVSKGLEVEMKDGEAVTEATKMAMEQNNYDDTNSFGRKIDVLINVKDTTTTLNSDEWKASKTNHLKLTQQSKSISSNCTILNNIHIITSGQVSSTIALHIIVKDLSSAVHDACSEEQGYNENNTVLPTIFFTLKNKRAPKRAYEEIDDSED